ncbi:MAG: hypothetical protein IT330_08640 [Anaerolineae bacterium]|nr:hypothetical protein [Anaerolineae bacterium]
MTLRLTIGPDVVAAAPGARLGVLAMSGATVAPHDPALWAEIEKLAAHLAALYPNGHYSGDETLQKVRRLYHRLGVDPTRWRPSPEALVRRVVTGRELYQVNTAVDVINWCSLETRLPYGLYDAACITGDVVFRLGRAGETYKGIRKDILPANGKPVLADDLGPFGSPTADSERTMVRLETKELLVVVFGPTEVGEAEVVRATRLARERLERWCGAQTTDEWWMTA